MARSAVGRKAAADRHRLDRWLWFARFFRTRSLATQAVAGGKVRVNGEPAKPARELAAGDAVDIVIGRDAWTVHVLRLPARRGSAAEAGECYRETPESELRRRVAQDRRRRDRALAVAPPGRPDKRDRRAIRRLQGRTGA